MTLKEAKKILKKEGFKYEGPGKPGVASESFTEYESPEICEAMQIVCSAGYEIMMLDGVFEVRKERLKKEYEKDTKAPGSGEEQPKEKKGIIYPTTFPKADFYHKHVLNEGNPALAESASQFNDALLDEQSKEIERLKEKNLRLGKEIARLNKTIYKKNLKIEELRKESSRHLRGKIKMFGENVDLEQMLKDKNAVLSDVAEELRLTKIREKNLAELGLKYVGENEKLKKELADKVVDKIDAQALKSAESALAWKEKVIAEKDEVIADLGNELEATKKELEAFKESYKRRIKEDSEHFEHIQKICNAGLQKWLIESEYLEKDKPFRFPQLPDFSEEELMKLQEKACVDIAEEGKDHSGVIVLCGKDLIDALKKVKDVWQE